ncbi:MAG: hypothetical protein ACOVRN_03010 [Flavobacterium sp.]
MSDNLLNDLEKFKSQYYSDNKKNTLFKSAQKADLANRVCEQFGLNDLFIRTSFIIPNTNRVYINYPALKLFANPSNYEDFVNHTQSLFIKCINLYGNYECHVNLESLTVTAVERHKKLIEIFARDPSETGGIEYTKFLTALYIYNTPNVIETITRLISYLLEPELMQKIVTYNKADTTLKLSELLR